MVEQKHDNLVLIPINQLLDKKFFIPHYQRRLSMDEASSRTNF